MALLTTSLIAALAPAAIDALKSLFGGVARKIGGLSVEDEIKLLNANVEKLKALAELDNPVGTPSQWVVDLRTSFRYIAALGASIVGGGLIWFGPDLATKMLGGEILAGPWSFIFGERMLLGLKGIAK